ncbi:putative F-box protein At1g49610 [Magnolia sinica]|uniref:putative F-box protein At1g49610 n=1 Tax=Magnolia sinica TaxID=86752 RepID=UPI00265A5FC0|nr:putative F-box protein At1g49610 [Magnolia sinica]XP_058111757.1 putative F-box protein At1g49610 [Magnolia sinica]
MMKDRISDLPDFLIHEILSHLEMKDVVKTSVLSASWKHVWTQTPVLNFKHDHDIGFVNRYRSVEDFFRFVCCSLALHKCPKIHRIQLSFDYSTYQDYYDKEIDGLIHFAIARKASELKLDKLPGLYVLNLSLLEMGSLEVLKLHRCTIELPPPTFKGFRNLKMLPLSNVYFNGGDVEELLACSPILESLTVIEYGNDIRIPASLNGQLKHLSLKGEYELDICASNLLSLDISMVIDNFKYSPESASSLTDVSLDFQFFHKQNCFITRSEDRMMQEILKDVHRARVLKLHGCCIQVSPPISMHKCLVIESALKMWELPGIASLLKSSPDLQSLVIKEIHGYLYLDQTLMYRHESVKKGYLESRFSCLLHRLKTIKISGLTKGMFVLKNIKGKIQLVKVLLKHAVVLEKMTIHITHKSDSCDEDKVNLSRSLSKLGRKVQAFDKASTRAEVLFLYDFDQ